MQRYLWLVVLVFGLIFTWSISDGRMVLGVLVALCVLLVSWWMSPFSGGRTAKHADVMALPAEQRRAVIYWRPGCIFCQRLKGGLGADAKKATWINIWQDPEAAAFVRSVNDGNEVVPTVVLDEKVHTNPDPSTVREVLAG